MTYEELRAWCHGEMRAAIDTPIHKRAAAILKLVDVATMPPWLADAAEALGEVRHEDGAPKALNWTQVLAGIGDMREERDEWKKRAESAEYALAAYLCLECKTCLMNSLCTAVGDAIEAATKAERKRKSNLKDPKNR